MKNLFKLLFKRTLPRTYFSTFGNDIGSLQSDIFLFGGFRVSQKIGFLDKNEDIRQPFV